MLKNHRVAVWYPFGRADLYNQTVNSIVKVKGKEESSAKVFRMDDEKLLVYSPDSGETYGVIIVDKVKNDIGMTNSGEGRYELLFDSYLFQDDSAKAIIYASDAKWDYNPNLVITDSRISYTTQKRIDGKLVDIPVDIFFKGE